MAFLCQTVTGQKSSQTALSCEECSVLVPGFMQHILYRLLLYIKFMRFLSASSQPFVVFYL